MADGVMEEDFSEELDRANTTIVEMGKVIERLQKAPCGCGTAYGICDKGHSPHTRGPDCVRWRETERHNG